MKKIRIGSGAGYAGDRIEPAIELIEKGNLDYIGFECLAERTIALANQRKLKNPELGYDEMLEYRMEQVLEPCARTGTKLISNMGAANPKAAVRIIGEIAKRKGLNLKIAAVSGDDVMEHIDNFMDHIILETGKPLRTLKGKIISANAYMGSNGIVEALMHDADIVITGRVADPALFLAPLIYEHNWVIDESEMIGRGILCGHLLECSSQVCGGYYADPGQKEVTGLLDLGFPFAEVDEAGDIIISILSDSGGIVTEGTCKEQLLYEIQDPANYFTPDCIADFSKVEVKEIEKNRVLIRNASGKQNTGKLKVSFGYIDGFVGEGQISYGGSSCLEKAKIAGEIIRNRLKNNTYISDLKIDYIGYNSLFEGALNDEAQLYEVRLRVAARTSDESTARLIGNEVEALYLNGPSGGGGAEKSVKETVAIGSIFIDEHLVRHKIDYEVTGI